LVARLTATRGVFGEGLVVPAQCRAGPLRGLRALRRPALLGIQLTLLPRLIGIAFLFYNGRSVVGWLLTSVGAAIILAGVLMNMDIYFRQTSLFNTIVMLGLLFGGLGLVARSLRSA